MHIRNTLLLLLLPLASLTAQENTFYRPASATSVTVPKGAQRTIWPADYKVYGFDYEGLRAVLAQAPREFTSAANSKTFRITLPDANGNAETFAVFQTGMMEPALETRFPGIRTYAGVSVTHPGRSLRITTSLRGLRVMVLRPDMGVEYLEPYVWGQTEHYIMYNRADLPANENRLLARTWMPDESVPPMDYGDRPYVPAAEDRGPQLAPVELKIYRYVVAATGEFTQDHGGTEESGFAAVVEYTNMISAIYERDMAMRLQLVPGSADVVYANPDTDPYQGTDVIGWMSQNPIIVSSLVGTANFDIGHVYARYMGGAAIGVAGGITCTDGKARGCSAGNGFMDYGDFFVSVIGQEVGHQLSGGHTWNRCGGGGGRAGLTAFEPGSGSTIMSYAGACGSDNIQFNTDLYFHSGSIEEIQFFFTESIGNTCGTFVATTNNAPTVTLSYVDNFFIPIGTPFELEGTASDPDGETVNYCWEEIDAGPETPLGEPIGNTATFRTILPVDHGQRYFPKIQTVINNQTDMAEQLPSYSRDLTFRLTARDNRPEGGGVGWADVAFKATALAGPFVVLEPNTASVTWRQGTYVEVRWDVANSHKAPVSCSSVDVQLSTDGGFTYPITLASGTGNDGSQFVLVPNGVLSTKARVRVKAANNIFYDISNSNFRIEAAQVPAFGVSLSNDAAQICLPEVFSTNIASAAVLGFGNVISLDIVGGVPPGADVNFTNSVINPGESTGITVNLNGVTVEGDFDIVVRAVADNSDTLLRVIRLHLVSNNFSALALESPVDGTTGLEQIQSLFWNLSNDAETYEVQLATSPSFATATMISAQSNLTLDSFYIPVFLEKNTAYYWRVRPFNECGVHDWTEPYFFSTLVESCSVVVGNDLPKNISASTQPTIESKINVLGGAMFNKVNVKQIKGYHEFFGDLEANLISPQGTTVLLFKNRCNNYNGYFNFGMNDVAPTNFLCPPSNNGTTYQPQNDLSAMSGQPSTGEWTLRIKDNQFGAGGQLTGFELEFCSSVSLNPPYLVKNIPLQLNSGANAPVGGDLLLVEDANNTASELIYTLVTKPQFGRMEKNWGGEMQPGDQFTQADINSGAVRYFEYGYSAGPDFFRFTVTDGEGGYFGTPAFEIQPLNVSTGNPANEAPLFMVHPNPTRDGAWVSLSEALTAPARVTVISAGGQWISEQELPVGTERLWVPLNKLPIGLYMVRLEAENGVAVRKLVKGE